MENGAWKEPLWQTLGDAGLPLAWVPEKLGGSGASLAVDPHHPGHGDSYSRD
jgi:hypothetical protein